MFNKIRKERKRNADDNGFEAWGGYMNAKISKLEAQFKEDQISALEKEENKSNIFKGISIFVNGFTEPSADELRCLMLQHGGVYHHYYRSGKTTHVIASSLPNAKFDQMKTLKLVRSEWITESIKAGKLLDYKNFLLQNNFPLNGNVENHMLNIINNAFPSTSKKDLEIPKTAADDGYLDDFYKNSRLHYISTLGAMLKQQVLEKRENHNGVFPGRKNLEKFQQTDRILYSEGERVVMHIDMDCFFVSVALRNRPELKGKPVAVTHSKGKLVSEDRNVDRKFEREFYRKKMKAKLQSNESSESDDDFVDEWSKEKSSMSEIASCSYEARKAGVSKGMYLGVALKICPNLKTVPYDFDGYREVSLALYNTVADYTLDIESISCDELFIDCSNLISELKIDPMNFAEVLRREIEEKTKCTSSVGIGCNKLQARLATKRAKPNGQFHLTRDKVDEFMEELRVWELPGVGRTIRAKLKTLNVYTCGQLQDLPMVTLKKEFGEKTGETLYKHCRGEDDRKVSFIHERKSVSAEINYGIRFNDDEETETFLQKLSEEVSKRLKDIKMLGKNITFKVMYRAKDAPMETAKFLGHGACDAVNRSVALPFPTDNPQIISRHVISVYHQLKIPANELRGIGIQITKLESVKKTPKTLQDFLTNQSKKPTTSSKRIKNFPIIRPPTASQVDPEVLASLPEDIRQEVLREYGLVDIMQEEEVERKKEKEEEETHHPKGTEPELEDEVNKLSQLNLNDMRTMIKEWVMAEECPRSYDTDMLKNYLSKLVEKKKLETVTIIVKCLNRQIKTKRNGDEIWKETYRDVVDALQNSMLNVFGKVLACDTV